MTKPPKRPIDAKDMPWSYIGKDALDAAAERLWELIREDTDADIYPYTWGTEQQATAQKAVLDLFGNAVPKMLRQRAGELKSNGASVEEVDVLRDLADELEELHG